MKRKSDLPHGDDDALRSRELSIGRLEFDGCACTRTAPDKTVPLAAELRFQLVLNRMHRRPHVLHVFAH